MDRQIDPLLQPTFGKGKEQVWQVDVTDEPQIKWLKANPESHFFLWTNLIQIAL